jgi:hypothetical protein
VRRLPEEELAPTDKFRLHATSDGEMDVIHSQETRACVVPIPLVQTVTIETAGQARTRVRAHGPS